ncbi:MAG: DUF554 family protein [Chthonomonas sp.]|nr:DUF554 family protein [Chthonomonas sp.]
MKSFRGAGTVLNFLTVLIGGGIGLLLRTPMENNGHLLECVKFSLGVVTLCIGVKLFLAMRNPVVVALSVALGGMLGALMGLDQMVSNGALWLENVLGGGPDFKKGLVLASVVFCVGPMTILGCMRDAIDRNIDLLKLKSTMDGLVAIFFAAAFGAGVVASAFVVLIIQGLLTILAAPLKGLAQDQEMLDELSGAGGPVLFIVGLSLSGLKEVDSANWLLVPMLAPLIVFIFRLVRRPAVVGSA